MSESWFEIKNIKELDSPALVVFPERVKHNIQLAIDMIGDVDRLRPHIKTNKSPDVARLMLQAGIDKFKCATIAEAEMLAQCNAPDVLLAYQSTGPKIARLLKLIQAYPFTHFSCLVDSADAAQEIAAEAMNYRLTVNVLLDVNVGMNRTGVLPQNVAELHGACRKLKGINVIGVHGYDGHINDADVTIRKQR